MSKNKAGVYLDRFRVRPGDRSALTRDRPGHTGPFSDKKAAQTHLEHGVVRLEALQERLYAQGEHALVVLLQGMDASGKDSAITHVMSGVNPLGTEVHAFKQPSSEELAHDFLWRSNALMSSSRSFHTAGVTRSIGSPCVRSRSGCTRTTITSS